MSVSGLIAELRPLIESRHIGSQIAEWRNSFFLDVIVGVDRRSQAEAMSGPHLDADHELRIAKAQRLLRDAAGGMHSRAFVNVGDVIPVDHEAGYLRSHFLTQLNCKLCEAYPVEVMI